jgi:hypothetical protein
MNAPRMNNTLSHDLTPQSLRYYELLNDLSKFSDVVRDFNDLRPPRNLMYFGIIKRISIKLLCSLKPNQTHPFNLGLDPLLPCANTQLGLKILVTERTIVLSLDFDHQLEPDFARDQNLNVTPNQLMPDSFEPFSMTFS